jgi:hypothetical protein
MAETLSVEYAAIVSAPRGNVYGYGRSLRKLSINYTQVLVGAANDTILLARVPPRTTISMFDTWFRWTGFTSGATLSVGWQAYRDEDGVLVAASAAGLLSGVVLTAPGSWNGGMLIVATPDDSLPVVDEAVLNNRSEVVIFATIGAQAPGIGAVLKGRLAIYTA